MARGQGARLYELRAAPSWRAFWCVAASAGWRAGSAEACDGIRGGASIACVTAARELLLALA